ncbi:hypothetical protein [Paracholeplasma manati]|uniref:hypothetical protein n=1 Tax=Paracholeplasma manati TaxID=591373 RepID=UPI002407B8C9|nr:hypothetical protein [Paracholeplasma manati]MDG0889238.1 hypothetical protein [Paracholeplasma manati]
MNYINVHRKKLMVPSFFQVYNFGGGNGDKDREIVYSEFTEDTPALINYYYINNEYPHIFSNKIFDNVTDKYTNVGDLYNDIRKMLISKGEIYGKYSSPDYDFNKKVFLLDSGAFSIIKFIAKESDYNIDKFMDILPLHIDRYYEFANQLHFDIVIGFDLGGKYTEKDGEKDDDKLMAFLSSMDEDLVNNQILEHTIRYLKNNPSYYPLVLATVHGRTPQKYAENTRYILSLEQKYGTKFWGFALGGIASAKQLDDSWFMNIDFRPIGNKPFKDTVAPALASKIVRSLIDDRPIHALGCGGYPSILLNYFNGATSFDAASPVRRVGDGNEASTKIVFNPTPSREGFSKYFMGGINSDGTIREGKCGYIKLNEVPDKTEMCGCKACNVAGNIHNIKVLYSLKSIDSEANYFSRQLIGLHAVMQHRKLCEIASNHHTVDEFCKKYNNDLFQGLLYVHKSINKGS